MDTSGVSIRESEMTSNGGDTHVHFICTGVKVSLDGMYLEQTHRILEFIRYTSNILAITVVPT